MIKTNPSRRQKKVLYRCIRENRVYPVGFEYLPTSVHESVRCGWVKLDCFVRVER